MTMKFLSEDNGNCRVYYRGKNRSLYCYQLDRPGVFKFLRCSKDGEPSYEVDPPADIAGPRGDTAIVRELNAFLQYEQDATELRGRFS